MRKYFLIASAFIFMIICLNHKVIAQSFQTLYAKNIQFESNGVGINLITGGRIGNGQATVTIPDGTGTIVTSYNNYNQILVALKAIDAGKGNHSGINWTSLGV